MVINMKLYFRYLGIHLRSVMQYKLSFLLTTIGQFLVSFSAFLGIYFMFSRFHSVNEFTYNEVLLCFSVILMSFSLAECFVRGFDAFSSTLSNGEFDRIMLRPQNEMFQVLASKIEFSRIGRVIQAIVMLIYAIATIPISWSADKIITLILMIIGGLVMFSGLFIVYASFCFFTTEGLEFMNIFTDGAREFGRYPMSVYGKNVLKFCTYIVPIALVQYYPLLYLLGKTDNTFYMITPLFAFVFFLPCYLFWKCGVRHYKSTGS